MRAVPAGIKQLRSEADQYHLVPRLRRDGAIPLLPHVIMACIGTT
jgi:hypothetical protein